MLTIFSTQVYAQKQEKDLPWKLWKSTDTRTVNYRKSPYDSLIEIKATARLDSSLAGFLLFIQETSNMPNWLDNTEYAVVIKQYSINENLFLTKFHGFWPIEARDMVVFSRYWQNDDLSIEIAVEDAGAEIPLTENTTRMEVKKAHWKIVPTSEKGIYVEYVFTVDTKGDLPAWLAKRAALSGIWRTLENLEQQLPSSIWQTKQLPNIKEYVVN